MGIKAKFTKADVAKMLAARLERIETVIISRFSFIGETFVRNARLNGTYNDVTGNLRSSIAYIIVKNGRTVLENFEKSDNGNDKAKGVEVARNFINEIKTRYPKGYVLICVAGMEYAAAVESKGKDVITASAISAQQQLQKAIRQIKNQV